MSVNGLLIIVEYCQLFGFLFALPYTQIMGKDFLRIDDRLIHGQIVMAWCKTLNIKEIVGIDDKLVANKTLQSIMLMGIPAVYKKAIVSSEDARKMLAEKSDHNRLFVTRWPQDLLNFSEELLSLDTVYVGNAAKTPTSKFSFSREGGSVFFASDEDIQLFDDLSAQGVKLIVQTVPNAPAKTWIEAKNTLRPI